MSSLKHRYLVYECTIDSAAGNPLIPPKFSPNFNDAAEHEA